MKKKALIVVNLAGFLHFLWNDIATLQEMGYEVSVAMNENSAAGPNLIEIPKLEEMGIAHYQVEFDTKSPISTQNIQAYGVILRFVKRARVMKLNTTIKCSKHFLQLRL